MNRFSKFDAQVICELHPLFKGLLWVSAARSEDETRLVLTTMLVEREGPLCHIVATDGRRLHRHTFDPGLFDTDIDMVEPGLYEVVAKTAKLIVIAESDIGAKYPNWRQVIPDYEPEHSDSINEMTISKIGIITGVLLATDFVQDAIGFGYGRKKGSQAMIEYGSPDKTGAFVIQHDLGKAIVMPMKFFHDEEQDLNADAPKNQKDATPDFPDFARGPIIDVESDLLTLPAPAPEPLALGAPADVIEAEVVTEKSPGTEPALTDEQKLHIDEVRDQGMDARSAGMDRNTSNPFPLQSMEHSIWHEGFDAQHAFILKTAGLADDDDLDIKNRADAPNPKRRKAKLEPASTPSAE